jgi:replicative superfamily II helicase
MEFIEVINTKYAKKRIFVITPERGVELFKNLHKLNIELFLFDEAQISEEEIRGMRFDSLVRRIDRLVPNARKVFTHPFIDNPEAQLKKHGFEIDSDFKKYEQNSVGKIYLSVTPKKEFSYFSPFTKERNIKASNIVKDVLSSNGTVLIYVSKEKIYDGRFNEEFSEYIDLCPKITNPDALKYINWLKEFIGASDSEDKNSTMINMMERGIVFHHGSMPLKARLLIEEFVNKNFAKICFATSTLAQGINMPFNIVWINNYQFRDSSKSLKALSLKNLIGRSGRVSNIKNSFDYGYVILEEENVDSFCTRLDSASTISELSKLDDILEIGEDMLDIVDAIRDDTFDDELQLTESQVDRLKKANNDDCIKFILDRLLIDQKAITASDYYAISKKDRVRIKEDFKKIFISHLRRNELTLHEQYILSTSIPILLWQIQGKSFSEIISLRYAFLSKKDDRRKIDQQLKKGEITQETAKKEIKKLTIKYSPPAASIPILKAKKLSETSIEDGTKKPKGPPGLYPHRASVEKIKYDRLVYDTYDYIDKVISLSLRDPISAALLIYYQKTGDERAMILSNYLKYGTNDNKEIWLIRYGFSFDEIEWLKAYVDSIDEKEIIFNSDLKNLDEEKIKLIERFVN